MGNASQPLGKLLVEMGFLEESQLALALEEQRRTGRRLGRILIDGAIMTEERLVHALSHQLGLEACDPIMTEVRPDVLALIPAEIAFQHHVLPVARRNAADGRDLLYVATADPLDRAALEAVRAATGSAIAVRWMLAGETEIELALARHYGASPAEVDVLGASIDLASLFSATVAPASPEVGGRAEEPPDLVDPAFLLTHRPKAPPRSAEIEGIHFEDPIEAIYDPAASHWVRELAPGETTQDAIPIEAIGEITEDVRALDAAEGEPIAPADMPTRIPAPAASEASVEVPLESGSGAEVRALLHAVAQGRALDLESLRLAVRILVALCEEHGLFEGDHLDRAMDRLGPSL